jgi:hypothetical protein
MDGGYLRATSERFALTADIVVESAEVHPED